MSETPDLDKLIAEARQCAEFHLATDEMNNSHRFTRLADALEATKRERDEARAFAAVWKRVAKQQAMIAGEQAAGVLALSGQLYEEGERLSEARADAAAFASALDEARAKLAKVREWADNVPLVDTHQGKVTHPLAGQVLAILDAAPTVTTAPEAEHKLTQEMPHPPFPEADYMLSSWRCSCGWKGPWFRDVRGEDGPRLARETAERHLAEFVTTAPEPYSARDENGPEAGDREALVGASKVPPSVAPAADENELAEVVADWLTKFMPTPYVPFSDRYGLARTILAAGFHRSTAPAKPEPDFATLIATIKQTGGTVEVAGVKIAPCDEYGRTEYERTHPLAEAEPVAYEVRDRATGDLLSITLPTHRADFESEEHLIAPLYRHPAPAPEVTDEMVETALRAYYSEEIPTRDVLNDLLRDDMRKALSAAFAEMGKN